MSMSEPQPVDDGTRPVEPEPQGDTTATPAQEQEQVVDDDDGGNLQRTQSPITPNSAVIAGTRLQHRASLTRTRTDSLEHRTRKNSPRHSNDLPSTLLEEPVPDGAEHLPTPLIASGRSRSLSGSVETLKAHERPRLTPRDAGIPEFKQSTDLTSMELQSISPVSPVSPVRQQRSPPPLRFLGSRSFGPLYSAAGVETGALGTPRDSDETVHLETATSIASEAGEIRPDDAQLSNTRRCLKARWQQYTKKAEDPLWLAQSVLMFMFLALVVLLALGGLGCSPYWFPNWFSGDEGGLDPLCATSSSQQCGTETSELPVQPNTTEVDPLIAQLEKTFEHVRKLRTDMDYLQISTMNEERHQGTSINQFQHQKREVKRAQHVIAVIKRRLVELGVVKRSTTLDCDWMDEDKMAFRRCTESAMGSCPSARGCHEPVQHRAEFKLLRNLLEQDLGQGAADSELGGSDPTTFDCFDSDGLPQGCHAHAMQRLALARFRVGCVKMWQPQLWGWCGEYPWSHWISAFTTHSQSGGEDEVDAYKGRCTTLLDVFQWVIEKLKDYSLHLGSMLYAWSYLSKSLTSLQAGLEKTKAGVFDLQARASGMHNRSYVNRVSLSLNLLLPSFSTEEGDDAQERKYKLLPRTLWERDLSEIMNDPDQRKHFRAAANATTEKEPFLRDSLEGAEREERKLVINLFSNHISSICSTNFILQDLGEAVQEEAFVFGLTFEEAWTADATGNDDVQSGVTRSSEGDAAAEPSTSNGDDSGSAQEQAKNKQNKAVDQNHVQKIRVLMLREKMLRKLLTMTEDDIEFQSDSSYHKMRLKHLKMMATKWDEMGARQKRAKRDKSKMPPVYDYIGKVRLCVPVNSHGVEGRLHPRSRSSQSEPAGDPYDVTTPPDWAASPITGETANGRVNA